MCVPCRRTSMRAAKSGRPARRAREGWHARPDPCACLSRGTTRAIKKLVLGHPLHAWSPPPHPWQPSARFVYGLLFLIPGNLAAGLEGVSGRKRRTRVKRAPKDPFFNCPRCAAQEMYSRIRAHVSPLASSLRPTDFAACLNKRQHIMMFFIRIYSSTALSVRPGSHRRLSIDRPESQPNSY